MKNLHGGDILSFEQQYGEKPLDFSASLNPLGMPEGVKNAVLGAVSGAYAYPDPYSRLLSARLAEALGISPSQLIFGNGSAELMYLFASALRPKRALLPVPSFSEYECALNSAESDIVYHKLNAENGFRLDISILDKIEGCDALFLCQPNNPTGQLIDSDLLDAILQKCAHCGTKLFLDECFLEFIPDGKAISKISQIERFKNLFILGSFTKLYGMAGLRLGYGICADKAFLERMESCRQPWSVSALAQAAGIAALEETDFVNSTLELIETEKTFLSHELKALGIKAVFGEANYLFFYTQNAKLKEQLSSRGILIRDCSSFRGLSEGCYRIAIRTRSENERLIGAIRETNNG